MTLCHYLALLVLGVVITALSWRKGRHNGYAFGWPAGLILITPLAHLAGLPWLNAFGVAAAWSSWRCFPPHYLAETMTPITSRDLTVTYWQHLVLAALLLIPLWGAGLILLIGLPLFALFASLAAQERSAHRYDGRGQDIGPQAEAAQGLAYAVLVAASIISVVHHG